MNSNEPTSVDTQIRGVLRDHAVRYFERDVDLVEEVSEFFVAGLRDGDVVMSIATAAHVSAIENGVRNHGLDVEALREQGRFDSIDADEVMLRRTDADLDRVLSAVATNVDAAAQAGRRVRIFGELVALLWNASDVEGAMDLERLWNRLRANHPYDLLCAYSTESLTAEDAAWFSDVSRMHATLESEHDSHARSYPCDTGAPAAARRFVEALLADWQRRELIEDARIVVAELATNAVLHARSKFSVAVSRRGAAVRIAVRDDSRHRPVVRRPDPSAISGRGLMLVSSIAKRWGIDVLATGKVVWADLA